MDFVKKQWAQVRVGLDGLSYAHKALIAALLTIVVLTGWLLISWAAEPERVPITGYSSERVEEVAARLKASGIDVQSEGGRVTVPADQQLDAIARLAEDNLLRDDPAGPLVDLIKNQRMWSTKDQNARAYLIATQQTVGQIASRIDGVRSADVVISVPERRGFGRTYQRPSASVTVRMQGNRRVDSKLTEALAGLVSSAVAELTPQDVVVVDAQGKQHRVGDPEDELPTHHLELVRSQERYHQQKIEQAVAIPGAIVAVKIITDPMREATQTVTEFGEDQPIQDSETESSETREFRDRAEAGVRPNVGVDLDTDAGPAVEDITERRRETFMDPVEKLRRIEQITGHTIKQINVTINVPRGHFVRVFKARQPEAKDPDDNALQPLVDERLTEIEKRVKPLLIADAGGNAGIVHASMFYDDVGEPAAAATAPGSLRLMGVDVGSPAVLATGVLALAAVGCMFYLVRRATRQEDLPSIEELAGVPPSLPTDDELIGEAEQMETSLAGVELDEDELRARKVAEQIGEMVLADPEEAGALLGKWVNMDD